MGQVGEILLGSFFLTYLVMDAVLLIILFLFCIVFPLWRWYQPKIEVVVLVKHFRVYMWYNKWDGPDYRGRVYKYLFEI